MGAEELGDFEWRGLRFERRESFSGVYWWRAAVGAWELELRRTWWGWEAYARMSELACDWRNSGPVAGGNSGVTHLEVLEDLAENWEALATEMRTAAEDAMRFLHGGGNE